MNIPLLLVTEWVLLSPAPQRQRHGPRRASQRILCMVHSLVLRSPTHRGSRKAEAGPGWGTLAWHWTLACSHLPHTTCMRPLSAPLVAWRTCWCPLLATLPAMRRPRILDPAQCSHALPEPHLHPQRPGSHRVPCSPQAVRMQQHRNARRPEEAQQVSWRAAFLAP